MDRRTRTLVVVGIAVVFAGIATFLVWRTLIVGKQVPPPPKVTMVVSTKDLAAGKQLAAEDLREVEAPATYAMPGALAKTADAVGSYLRLSVVTNEPIIRINLTKDPSVQATIPDGMRAISLQVNDIIGVAGFVKAGDKVDVILTETTSGETSARIVLSNVVVFTAGKGSAEQETTTARQEREQKTPKEGSLPKQSTVVTVLVTPLQAAKLALAQQAGSIVLALRNPKDGKPAVSSTTMIELLGRSTRTVDAIRGSVVKQEAVKK